MKNKIIDLFQNPNIVENQGKKYAELLQKFIKPFETSFSRFEYFEDIFEFAISAWNFGNMKLIIPVIEFETILKEIKKYDKSDYELMLKMIDYKTSHFAEYTNFIQDFQVTETNGEPILTVITQEQDVYFSNMFDNDDEELEPTDEESFIDRIALIVRPLEPFLNWYSHLYPNSIEELDEIKTYLIKDNITDAEEWLKKKFKKIFEFELETRHLNKKEWPQKRNYKMFTQWFHVEISPLVYDFENKPVHKYDC